MRVFSVASRAAFPLLPLARTQNLTMGAVLLELPGYTLATSNKMGMKCLGALSEEHG